MNQALKVAGIIGAIGVAMFLLPYLLQFLAGVVVVAMEFIFPGLAEGGE